MYQGNHMVQAWKIAPGKGAEDWSLFREHGCIGVGWLKRQDYRRYHNEMEVLAALEQLHGEGTRGYGAGAARMVWQFVEEVKPSHIVVANQGFNRVVGIGVVTSEYLAPQDDQNPVRDDTSTHRHHVHLVEWLVTEPVDLPGNRFFVQAALSPLEAEKLNQVMEAYVAKFPQLRATVDQLLSGYPAGISGWLPDEVARSATLVEGAVRQITVNAYERNPKARRQCIAAHQARCHICGFDFGTAYGPEFAGFIHVHHLRPLAEIRGEYIVDPIEDLRPVCPNCHAIIHHGGGKPRSIEEVQQLLAQQRAEQGAAADRPRDYRSPSSTAPTA